MQPSAALNPNSQVSMSAMFILLGHSVRRGGCPYARPRTILFLRYVRRTGIESSDSARTVAANFGIRVEYFLPTTSGPDETEADTVVRPRHAAGGQETVSGVSRCSAHSLLHTYAARKPRSLTWHYTVEYFLLSALILARSLGTPVFESSSPSYSADVKPLYPPWANNFHTRSRSRGFLAAL